MGLTANNMTTIDGTKIDSLQVGTIWVDNSLTARVDALEAKLAELMATLPDVIMRVADRRQKHLR